MRKSLENDETACGGGQRKRGFSRFSLRRLLYASPIVGRRFPRNTSGSSKSQKNQGILYFHLFSWYKCGFLTMVNARLVSKELLTLVHSHITLLRKN